ncbi:MAG TPA: carboxypeptidase regulatory-like domain-containing protein [Stenotrophomonas sp.]|nr:carboxypeptidase regulatory-like domain-containing protein [Stenotrophomonas sp.]
MSVWQIGSAVVLALAAVVGVLRLLRQPALVPHWRRVLLLALQPACALLLYLALYPPARVIESGTTLVVLTAGAPQPAAGAGEAVVALPEANAAADVPVVPDLATALRQRPDIARLRVLGQGLPTRDHEAVGTRALIFEPTALPPGLIGLSSPAPVAPGNAFAVRGQVSGLPGAGVELLDPAGRRVDMAMADAQGGFSLIGQARIAGEVLFAVRVLDARGTERDRQPLPLRVIDAAPLRVWIQAGAPQPEWKYLRRWAADAGLTLHTQIATGAGLQLGDASLPLDAATLAGFDLLWLDQRALAALSRSQREAVLAAARRGLGVLIRLDGPADASLRQALAQFGLPLRGGDGVATVATGAAANPAPAGTSANADASEALPALTRRDFAPSTALPVLARDARGQPYAWWHALGQGRIGVTTITDTYRLTLAGAAAAHARQWSDAVATLARPRAAATSAAELPELAWTGERSTLCGLGADAQVRDPTSHAHALQRDPASGSRGCAAYWPQQPGWHVLAQGEQREPFFVRDPAQARAWHLRTQADATQLMRSAPVATTASAGPGLPSSRWPAWWAFVLLAAASWWLERPRRG